MIVLEKLLTTQEVAELLRIDPQTVVRLAQRGELPAFKVARQWRYSTAALEEHFKLPKRGQGGAST